MKKFRSLGFHIEFIVNIFFFLLITAVVFSAFAQAYGVAAQVHNVNTASVITFSALQNAKADCTFGEQEDEYAFYYDESWNPCQADSCTYILILTCNMGEEETGEMWYINARVRNEAGEIVYEASALQFVPHKTGGSV